MRASQRHATEQVDASFVSAPAPSAAIVWTPEQQAAIRCAASHLRLTALAGCGKSAVLSAYAAARPRQRWQYLAFNRSMANEAAAEFPGNVRATTFHAWAWPRYGVDLAPKMDKPLQAEALARVLALPLQAPWLPGYLAVLSLALERFTRSAETLPGRIHIPAAEWALWRQSEGAREALDINIAVAHLEQMWFHAQDPGSLLVPASPDTAIKRAQLGRLPPLAAGLLVDEAQDLSPAMLAWICQSAGPRVRAGDPYQTLYAWRAGGAGDWELPGEQGQALTTSHRFGPQIESWVNPVLAALGCPFPLLGAGPQTNIHLGTIASPHWVLGRTRALLLAEAGRLQAQGLNVAWRGDRAWERVAQLQALRDGEREQVRDPWLRGFASLEGFMDAARAAGLEDWVGLAEQVAQGKLQLDPSRFVSEDKADAVLSTVHQAKGMSIARVRLLEDVFANTSDAEQLRVRYVALTRAKVELSLPSNARRDDVVPAAPVVAALAGDGF